MTSFLTENFLLETEAARQLYFEAAEPQPIFDYHGHLPPRLIAENHQFRNLTEIWLEGDHYKWRAMRANGVPERLCSGDAPDYEKFLAFVQTIPYTLRNPLYHWSHLELQRYFNIGLPINEGNAPRIWAQANECLASPEYRVQGLLKSQRVGVVVTTDDPVDPLDHHQRHGSQEPDTCLYPAFRPDAALRIENPVRFNEWCDRLASVCQRPIRDLPDFLEALRLRHDFFHAQGCRLSDHGLEFCLAETVDEDTAARIFRQAREGQSVTPLEVRQFGSHLMLFFGKLDAARGWTKQLHLGALRNNNQRLAGRIGADAGADSIGDFPQAGALARYLNALDREESLPKMILYNLNPADNYLVATMAGNFYGEGLPGKIQYGSGWWFLDQIEGMTWQINALSNIGLLRRFIGMTTDSRSFLSFPRHEYFRRLLCNILGNDVHRGLLPSDMALLGTMVREISFDNARQYFGLPVGSVGVQARSPVRSAQ